MPEPMKCGECAEILHTPYTSDIWQIRRDVVVIGPDGRSEANIPFAAVACSARCAAAILIDEQGGDHA